jgi:hypothetical protein
MDGQMDMMKLIVAFCNFVHAPKNSLFKYNAIASVTEFRLEDKNI